MMRKKSILCCLSLLLVAVTMSPARAGNWPGWRGPEGTGVSGDKDLPLKWSTSENVRWRAELPGPCNSSPIVWGDRLFITQAVDGGNRRMVRAAPVWGLVPAALPAVVVVPVAQEDRGDPGVVGPPLARGVRRSS